MLFLANDGNFIMEMPTMVHLIALAIKNYFHEIESVSLFSGNILSWVAGVKAVHRAYARKAQVTVPALEDYEKEYAANKVVPFSPPAQSVPTEAAHAC